MLDKLNMIVDGIGLLTVVIIYMGSAFFLSGVMLSILRLFSHKGQTPALVLMGIGLVIFLIAWLFKLRVFLSYDLDFYLDMVSEILFGG